MEGMPLRNYPAVPPIAVTALLKVALDVVPRAVTAPITTAAIRATIIAYSTAVLFMTGFDPGNLRL